MIEMVVATLLSTLLILGILAVFEANGRIARVQTDLAEMQQAQRVAQFDLVRTTRMAGRGGLPRGVLPLGLALSVRNNVDTDERISPGVGTTPEVLDATDVLTVRGVLTGTVYQISYATPGTFVLNGPPATATAGQVRITNPSNTSIPQDLGTLVQAVNDGLPEALIMVSPLSDAVYSVVELDPSSSDVSDPQDVTVGFFITGGTYDAEYGALSAGGAFSAELATSGVAYLGVLEEYRYYVREVRAGGELSTTLSRARVYPGTEVVHAGNAANWAIPISPDIHDLQVAIGVDDDGDGVVLDGLALGSANTDEWLFNDAGDNVNDGKWTTGDLYSVRVTTLALSGRPDPRYQAPVLQRIEDRDYGGSYLNTEEERQRRRRSLVTTVDLRNLG